MKKYTIVRLSGLLTFTFLLNMGMAGQICPAGRGHAGTSMIRMTEELDLTDEQKAEVKVILENHRSTMQVHYEEMSAAMENLKADLSGILTEEQLTKAKEIMEHGNRRARRRHSHEDHARERHERERSMGRMRVSVDRLAEQLELTEEQKSQIEEIIAAHKAEHEQVREANSAGREELKQQIESVLTDEQKEEWNELEIRWRNR